MNTHSAMRHPHWRWRDWWRPFRTGVYLAKTPRDIVPYLRYGLWCHKTPLDLAVPWWSFAATRATRAILRPEMSVFEFGSGGSTLYLAQQVKSVTCVEDSEEWVNAVRKAAAGRGLTNVQVLHRPFDFWNTSQFATSEYLNALSGRYDLIVVDGAEWGDQVRDICFWRAEDFVASGGFVILDDSWRYSQVKARNRAKRWRSYKGSGYCRRGTTETTIFEY